VTGYGRGAAAIGQGIENFGKGLEKVSLNIAEKVHQDDLYAYSVAKSKFTVGKLREDDAAAKDPDFGTIEQRYTENLNKLRDNSVSMVQNPRLRAKLEADLSDDVARGQIAVGKYAFGKRADADVAASNDELETLGSGIITAPDEAARNKIIDAARDRIDGQVAAGYISAETAQKRRREWVEGTAKTWVSSLPASERLKLTAPPVSGVDGVVDRIISPAVEGTGKNPNSSAVGTGQFIESTWLATLKKHGPADISSKIEQRADGSFAVSDAATRSEILALRNDPTLGREMTKALASDNAAALKSAGLEDSPGNIYLAHFLGVGTAAKVLKADPNTPISQLVGVDAIKANPEVLGGKTAGSVAAWAAGKMGGSTKTGTLADFLPASTRLQVYDAAQREVMSNTVQASKARGEQYEGQILNAAAGQGTLPDRAAIQSDPALTEPTRNTLLRQYDSAAGDVVTYQAALAKFSNPNGGSFNPYDDKERKAVDSIYKNLGGNEAALQAVVQRTGVVPKSALTEIRGAVSSSDPKRMTAALDTAASLLARNPAIFAGSEGASEIADAAASYRHFIDDLNMSSSAAVNKIIEQRSPEFQREVNAKIKTEDVQQIVNKNLSVSDLKNAFDTSWWPGGPAVGFGPEQRSEMFRDYAEAFADHYRKTGDINQAKALAQKQLAPIWGISKVSGSETVVRYPPEQVAGIRGVENASAIIGDATVAAVKAEAGKDVPRSRVMLTPIPGVTASQFKSGQPTQYSVSWSDEAGVLHMLKPGFAITVDGAGARLSQTETRRGSFESAAAAANVRLDRREAYKANIRSVRQSMADETLRLQQEVAANGAN